MRGYSGTNPELMPISSITVSRALFVWHNRFVAYLEFNWYFLGWNLTGIFWVGLVVWAKNILFVPIVMPVVCLAHSFPDHIFFMYPVTTDTSLFTILSH